MEEGGFLDRSLLTEVLLPIYQQAQSSLLGISSPATEEGHFYNKILEMKKKDGTAVFNVHEFTAGCRDCILNKRENCTHAYYTPRWLDKKKRDEFEVLYEGDKESYQREINGVVSGRSGFFPAADLKLLKDRRPTALQYDPAYIYIGFDPSGGGISNSSITSLAVPHGSGKLVVSHSAMP